ncbi:hypothetical protein ZIOFF_075808 [Zingiber officinale]|uniref:Uncharacterized protein n=1 Tax=Zingiber officinale TaxID=94328 RepID=A0A8J5C412_ZINOF|nr:hypothetical protein ZIOFF_075808 [Zingiber officinale]
MATAELSVDLISNTDEYTNKLLSFYCGLAFSSQFAFGGLPFGRQMLILVVISLINWHLDDISSLRAKLGGCLLRLVFANMAELLFEDIFTLTRIDPDGKKFNKGAELNGYKIRIANSYNISLEDAKASW